LPGSSAWFAAGLKLVFPSQLQIHRVVSPFLWESRCRLVSHRLPCRSKLCCSLLAKPTSSDPSLAVGSLSWAIHTLLWLTWQLFGWNPRPPPNVSVFALKSSLEFPWLCLSPAVFLTLPKVQIFFGAVLHSVACTESDHRSFFQLALANPVWLPRFRWGCARLSSWICTCLAKRPQWDHLFHAWPSLKLFLWLGTTSRALIVASKFLKEHQTGDDVLVSATVALYSAKPVLLLAFVGPLLRVEGWAWTNLMFQA